jgi:sec-independent protein translocase protein TatA
MELGAGEILVILAIVLLLFGPSKLPKLGEGLGSAISSFRKAVRGDEPGASASASGHAERRANAALPEASPVEQPRASSTNGVRSEARS